MLYFGVLTISDSCSKNLATDLSGQKLQELILSHGFSDGAVIQEYKIVPDNINEIQKYLKLFSETCDIILTTGGTGLSSRDVTPEATNEILNKQCPGIVLALLMRGIQATPMAMLSRLTSGIFLLIFLLF